MFHFSGSNLLQLLKFSPKIQTKKEKKCTIQTKKKKKQLWSTESELTAVEGVISEACSVALLILFGETRRRNNT